MEMRAKGDSHFFLTTPERQIALAKEKEARFPMRTILKGLRANTVGKQQENCRAHRQKGGKVERKVITADQKKGLLSKVRARGGGQFGMNEEKKKNRKGVNPAASLTKFKKWFPKGENPSIQKHGREVTQKNSGGNQN